MQIVVTFYAFSVECSPSWPTRTRISVAKFLSDVAVPSMPGEGHKYK